MKILFVSNDLVGADLAYRMSKEGCDVKLFVQDRKRSKNFTGLVRKTNNWQKELVWVGKDGLIVFDDIGFGKEQDNLRELGYRVFGGCSEADRLETDRGYAHKIFKKYGIKTPGIYDFVSIEEAYEFARKNRRPWVIKQNNQSVKFLNYVGILDSGLDVIHVLESYKKNKKLSKERISLQERIDGIEIGVGRYFNGRDWVGPIEFNIQHTRFLPGDIGPMTSEMGTVAWYTEDETNRLWLETTSRLKDYLKQIKFIGDFEINCIVNQDGIFPLEATPRLGSPIIHLHSALHKSPWHEFLDACASGKDYNLSWRRGFGIVVVIGVPPFPYAKKIRENNLHGVNVYHDFTEDELKNVHFEELSMRKDRATNQLYVSDSRGYVAYTTAVDVDFHKAFDRVYDLARRIILPKKIYRNDIGRRFFEFELPLLKKWGYLNSGELENL